MNEVQECIDHLKAIQEIFYNEYGVDDIFSSSKLFEILIANSLNHELIPGQSGSRDARDDGGEIEYKHYKETSCNHTWTFNDFSDATIEKLFSIKSVVFSHINDLGDYPIFDWYYEVPGQVIGEYMEAKTPSIKNTRKMINISPNQIENIMQIKKSYIDLTSDIDVCPKGPYHDYICQIYSAINQLEKLTKTNNILTSNKIWELVVGLKLAHDVLSEQTKYDAKDSEGNLYEYKVSRTRSFNFEDISDNVLNKFNDVKRIYMAVVDKKEFKIKELYEAKPEATILRLREKLEEKEIRYAAKGKEIRRLQVSLSASDLKTIGAIKLI